MMNQSYLFVYGTLLSNYEHPMSNFLLNNSELVGEGYMKGQLFKVATYPGAIYNIASENEVKGQVVQLENEKRVFGMLDTYEGRAYIRKKVPVKVGTDTLYCWVYLYILPIDDLEEIATGDYLAFIE